MLHYIWLSLAFTGVGIVFTNLFTPENPSLTHLGQEVEITGEITSITDSGAGDILGVKVNRYKTDDGETLYFHNFPIQALVLNSGIPLKVGDIVNAKALINEITENPNSFNNGYKSVMESKGVRYAARINSSDLNVIGHNNSLGSISANIRTEIEILIENSHISKNTQNFLITVLLGDKTYLDKSTRQIFADAGVSHVLALSGMHIGIIGSILLFILFPINFTGKYKLRLIIVAMLLWLYAFITGMAPSTTRACLMASFAALAIVLERKRYIYNSLFCSAFVILLFSPLSLYDIGFQLSFVCVVSLATFSGHINFFKQREYPTLYKASEFLFATTAATFGSWILCAYHFHTFPMSFLPANLLILPILPVYMVIALIYFVISSFGLEIGAIGRLMDSGFSCITSFLNWIGQGNSFGINVRFEMVILWCIGICLIGFYLNIIKWRPFVYSGTIALLSVFIMIPVQSGNVKDGSFILTDTYRDIGVMVKNGASEDRYNLKRGCISYIKIHDTGILSIDANPDGIQGLGGYDYLIIASGYKGKMEALKEIAKNKQVVIHPSIRKKRESQLVAECVSLGLKCHSLRNDLPLRHMR